MSVQILWMAEGVWAVEKILNFRGSGHRMKKWKRANWRYGRTDASEIISCCFGGACDIKISSNNFLTSRFQMKHHNIYIYMYVPLEHRFHSHRVLVGLNHQPLGAFLTGGRLKPPEMWRCGSGCCLVLEGSFPNSSTLFSVFAYYSFWSGPGAVRNAFKH